MATAAVHILRHQEERAGGGGAAIVVVIVELQTLTISALQKLNSITLL